MDKRVIPTLTVDSIKHDPISKLRGIISSFIASNYSQSNVFAGEISSLKYIMSNNVNDPTGMTTDIKNALYKLLNRYFNTVEVVVDFHNKDPKNENLLYIRMVIEVVDSDGVKATLEESFANSSTLINNLLDRMRNYI